MNAPFASRRLINPFLQPAVPTLADVCQQLAGSTLLPTRKRDYLSACRRTAELLGVELSSAPADPKVLRERLDAIRPVLARLSPKTLANLRSNLLGALESAGLSRVLKTAKIPYTSEWQMFTKSLPDRRTREGISRFGRFCSANGINPEQVSTEILQAFFEALDAGSLKLKAAVIVRDTATLWNRLVASQKFGQLAHLDWASRRKPSTRVDFSTLPGSFAQDCEAYLAWVLGTDLFDPNGRVKPLAGETGRLRRQQIQTAVTSLVASGVSPEAIKSLACLVTPNAVRRILKHRSDKVAQAANAYNDGIGKTLMSIAREWVKLEAHELETLNALRKRLPALRGDMTEKNKALLRHFEDPETLQRFYAVPQRLWDKAKVQRLSEKSLADAQAAVAIAILFYAPLRVANLTSLEIGRTLFLPSHPGGHATIDISAWETKNREPYRVGLPASVTQLLLDFEKTFLRPLGSRHLFDNGKGRAKRKETVSYLLERNIWRYMGFKMTEHQFRHLAAKIILDEEPGAYPILTQLLGHASLKTALRFYSELNTKRAARHHAMLLERTLERLEAEHLRPLLRRRTAGKRTGGDQ